jgi:membrane protein implicated in regulation of membrane protease activity
VRLNKVRPPRRFADNTSRSVLGHAAPRGQTVTIVRLEGTALVVEAG